MEKYLLSTGKSTPRLELYILDQFKIYLTANPGDIPGDSGVGFDFTLTNVMKSELREEVSRRVLSLVQKIRAKHGQGVSIEVNSLDIIDEERVDLVITVTAGDSITDELSLTLHKEEV